MSLSGGCGPYLYNGNSINLDAFFYATIGSTVIKIGACVVEGSLYQLTFLKVGSL
jgi:hypothetical protein